MTALILVLPLLAGVAQAQWRAVTYGGLRCAGQMLNGYEPLGGPPNECRSIEFADSGLATSMVFTLTDGATSGYRLTLHDADDCLSDGGIAECTPNLAYRTVRSMADKRTTGLPEDNSFCLELRGETFFTVESVGGGLAIRGPSVLGSALAVRAPGDLMDRQFDGQYDWIFSRAGAIVPLATIALQTCQGFFTGPGTAVACGLSALTGIALSVLAAVEFRRALQQRPPGQTRLADSDLADMYSEVFGLSDVPFISDDIIQGMTTTFTKAPLRQADGAETDPILHIMLQMTSHETGHAIDAMMDFDTTNNRTSLSHSPQPPSANRKRQADDRITAYYSYDNFAQEAVDATPQDTALATQLGNRLWAQIESTDQATYCANLAIANFNGQLESANTGFVSLITGQFIDEVSSCPT